MTAKERAQKVYRFAHRGWFERALTKMREQQKLEREQRMARVKFGIKVKI